MHVASDAPVAGGAAGGGMFEPTLESMSRDELAALQLQRLKRMLNHAYRNVAHYRTAFDAVGVSPEDLRSLEDIDRFPFTVKDDLRRHYPFGMFAVPPSELARLHASSGTTGRPTVVGYTGADLNVWARLVARCLAAAGARPGESIHNAYGYGLFTGGLGIHRGAEHLGCTVIPMSGGNTAKQIALLQDFGAKVLCSTPSYALNIAEQAEREGVALAGHGLRVGVFGAEPWSEALRRELQQRLGIRAVDIYGLSEVMGPGVAVECREAQNGLHGWEDHFLFEVIDPETGRQVPPGEVGELVITTLTKFALPMVRYRTRDVTRIIAEPCVCGRTHARIMRVTGRNDDMMIIRGVNVFPTQIEAVLVGFPEVAPQYRLRLTREGSLDALTVEAEAKPGVPAGDYARLAADVCHHIKSLIGVTARVVLVPPGALPRSRSKAARVIDERRG